MRVRRASQVRVQVGTRPQVDFAPCAPTYHHVVGRSEGTMASKEDIRRTNNAARAARNEVRSWVGQLDWCSFADTHNITEDEARQAIAMLANLAERL